MTVCFSFVLLSVDCEWAVWAREAVRWCSQSAWCGPQATGSCSWLLHWANCQPCRGRKGTVSFIAVIFIFQHGDFVSVYFKWPSSLSCLFPMMVCVCGFCKKGGSVVIYQKLLWMVLCCRQSMLNCLSCVCCSSLGFDWDTAITNRCCTICHVFVAVLRRLDWDIAQVPAEGEWPRVCSQHRKGRRTEVSGTFAEHVRPGAMKLVLWRHWMHLNYKHSLTSENQFHCTRLYIHNITKSTIWTHGRFSCHFECHAKERSSDRPHVQPGAVKLVLGRHLMHETQMHPVTTENQFHCTRLYVNTHTDLS